MQAAKSYPKSCPTSYNVLLVEDEGLIARDIAHRLEALGHHVADIVGTGEEAVEAAADADIVLMDIRLDGPMDGIEAAQTIRRRYRIPVIFLTAHTDRSMVERAKRAEPFGYIVKPVAPAALHTSIEIAVYKHGMERELAEREAWLTAVLGAVADAVAVADAEGRVRFLNPAAESLTGWSEAEARGQDLGKIVSLSTERWSTEGRSTEGRSVDERMGNGHAASAGEQQFDPRHVHHREGPVPLAMLRDAAVPLDRDAQLVTRGGRGIPVEGTAAPVRMGPVGVVLGPVGSGNARLENVAIGAVLSFRDVSRRRWEEQQIRQAQKVEAAARLAAGVADEYTHLLTVIRGQAERLLDHFGDYSPARQAAEEIRQAATTAEQITRKLAGFGKRQPAHPEVLSPNAVLRRLARLLETVAGPGVNVTVRPGPHAGKIKADEGQFEQLLMNLTMHAGRRAAASGEIRIETGPAEAAFGGDPGDAPGGYVRIAVSYPAASSPPGVAGEDSPFDPASAEDESLALSAAHNIASEHNGFFSARYVGNGAADGICCLEVLLPRWMEPEPAPAAIPPALTNTVLLVEPRETVRAELHKFFETNGFNLLEAADAGEAILLAEVREEPLDLVIAAAHEAGQIREVIEETLADDLPRPAVLRIVDAPEQSVEELRRSYTQAALLERVRVLLEERQRTQVTAAGSL